MGLSLETEKLICQSRDHIEKLNKMIENLGLGCLDKTKDESILEVLKIQKVLNDFVLIPGTDLVYLRNGHINRDEYLKYLSEEYLVDIETVNGLASVLGPDEDFDGLVASLEDL